MSEQQSNLDKVYSVGSGAALQRHYDQWADSYDDELAANDYRTPARGAEALARNCADKSLPVLDFACGTGLSGVALHAAGFSCIDGTDVSPGMLEQARAKGVYRALLPAGLDAPPDVTGAGYGAITAIGAIGTGAAPASCIDWALESLQPGGLFVVSLNDHTLEDPDYMDRVTGAEAAGKVAILEAKQGPHLPALGLGARVFVLQRR